MNPVSQVVTGAGVLVEWLGDGGQPVAQDVAERRAAVCVGCPLNVAPKWWEKSTSAVAMAMKRHLAARSEIGLSVSTEEQLHVCKVCGCCLPLKVHVPIEHIRSHTSEETSNQFPAHCWVKKEL